jgi:hypothetical protein
MAPDRSGLHAARPAVVAAALLVGPQVAAKATRDALFLSTYDVSRLPPMAAGAAIVSLFATLAFSRAMVRHSPARLLPVSLAGSGLLFLAEWALALRFPQAAAVAVYLHNAVLGAVLVSGFWSLINERFDPHTAKRAMGAVGAGASLGGVVGGLVTWWAAALVGPAAMLAGLAVASLLGVASLLRMGMPEAGVQAARPRAGEADARLEPLPSGLRLIRERPYLRRLAALVATCAFVEAVLDYQLGVEATRSFAAGGPLMSFFAVFHTGTGVIALALQAVATRATLSRLGVAGTLGLQPAFTLAGAALALVQPRLLAFVALRGGQAVLRNSLFRSSYELLFTPLPNEHKRPTKVIIDIACDRVGAAIGSGAVILVLLLAPAAATYVLLAVVALGALAGLVLAPSLHRGYVGALASSLRTGAPALGHETVVDPTALLTLASLQIDAAPEPSAPQSGSPPGGGAGHDDALLRDLADLCSVDRERIQRVTSAHEVDPRLFPQLIRLLARDGLYEPVAGALRRASDRCTGQLVDALLDPGLPSVVRRRVARVLKEVPSQRAVDGLLLGLEDARFDIQYRSAQALGRIHARRPRIALPREKVLEAAVRAAEHAAGSARHLEHVFTLLGLVLDREPLEIARRALHAPDRALRGTALEYLDNVLPPTVRERLWPHLASGRRPGPSGRSADEVRDDLLRSTSSLAPLRPRRSDSGNP